MIILISMDVFNMPIRIQIIRQMTTFTSRINYNMYITVFGYFFLLSTCSNNTTFSFLEIYIPRIIILNAHIEILLE